jgi:predicted CXXCH cytochrome family protein
MRTPHRVASYPFWHPLWVLPIILVAGCTDTVFRDREAFNPPPDAAKGFLGFFTASTKQTTCGNCHVGHQADWAKTKHASAYDNLLKTVPNAPPECFSCHDVTARGNSAGLLGQAAGWDAVKDTTYQDVQCESCHGPGLQHVQAPDDQTKWPLPRVNVFDPAVKPDGKATCGACHNNEGHTPYVEQWAQSGHGDSVVNSVGGASCGVNCHNGKVALARFKGVRTNYVELAKNGLTYEFSQTCAVCHDPHSAANEHQLRAPVTTDSISVNLCTQCHNNSAKPSLKFTPFTSLNINVAATGNTNPPRGQRGAHGAQGPVVFGDAGWEPDGLTFQGPSSHGNASRNPDTCAGCHVVRFTVNDPRIPTGTFTSVGHLFQPVPCIDATGVPVSPYDDSCPFTATARNWSACTASGCHADANTAAQLLNTERATIATLASQLWADNNNNGYLDPAPTDQGYLAQVLANNPGEFADSTASTVAEKAFYNTILFSETPYLNAAGQSQKHQEGSHGVHNPFYYEAMLSATINAVKTTYNLANPNVSVRALMDRALTRPGVIYQPPQQLSPR